MQLNLNVSTKVNQDYRDYCTANDATISQGLTLLLAEIKRLEDIALINKLLIEKIEKIEP